MYLRSGLHVHWKSRQVLVSHSVCAAEKIARLLCRAHHDQFPRETQSPSCRQKSFDAQRGSWLLHTYLSSRTRPDPSWYNARQPPLLYSAQGNAPPKTFPGRVESAGKVARMYPTRTVEFPCDYDVVAARQREPGRESAPAWENWLYVPPPHPNFHSGGARLTKISNCRRPSAIPSHPKPKQARARR